MDPITTSITKKDPLVNEEALIDRDSDAFNTEITILSILCLEETCPTV